MIAVSSLLVVVALSLLVTRVATVVLVSTGLSRQVARFQARSALTGTGYVTRESEAITSHPLRRQVVMTLMLLGNVGLVASAGSLIIGFNGFGIGKDWMRVTELVVGLLALLWLSRSSLVDRWLTKVASRLLRRYTNVTGRDLGGLLQLTGDYSVTELAIRSDDWLAGRRLGELALRDEGVVVLGITRSSGRFLGAPSGSTQVRTGDLLVVYGREECLRALDARRRDRQGDVDHDKAVLEQRRREAQEEATDD